MAVFPITPAEIHVHNGERLGAVLKKLAKTKQWKQEALAKELGIQRTYLNRLMNGEQSSISGDLILMLARATGIPAETWWAIEGGTAQKVSPPSPKPTNPHECELRFIETGTSILVDHEIKLAIDCGFLNVSPYSETFVQPASLDLTIGEMTVDRQTRSSDSIGEQNVQGTGCEEIHLAPGELVYVETSEEIELASRIVGHLGPMRRYTVGGLFLNCGPQIDPGWKGNIVVAVANFGKITRRLKRGEPFLTIEFQFLHATPTSVKSDLEMPTPPEAKSENFKQSLMQTLEMLEDLVGTNPFPTSGMIERVNRLEGDVFGEIQSGTLRTRIEKLANELIL